MNLRPRKRTSPTIPIVAMVDILVITLLFVVATTTFKKSKKKDNHVQINLPQSSALGTGVSAKDVRTTLAITKDRKIFLDGAETEEGNLTTALTTMKTAHPGAKLELQADSDAPLGLLVKVWDSLKASGYSINEVPARIQRAAAAAGKG